MRHTRLMRAGLAAIVAVATLSGCASIKDHRGFIVDRGRLTLSGPARELAGNPAVREAYMGLGAV